MSQPLSDERSVVTREQLFTQLVRLHVLRAEDTRQLAQASDGGALLVAQEEWRVDREVALFSQIAKHDDQQQTAVKVLEAHRSARNCKEMHNLEDEEVGLLYGTTEADTAGNPYRQFAEAVFRAGQAARPVANAEVTRQQLTARIQARRDRPQGWHDHLFEAHRHLRQMLHFCAKGQRTVLDAMLSGGEPGNLDDCDPYLLLLDYIAMTRQHWAQQLVTYYPGAQLEKLKRAMQKLDKIRTYRKDVNRHRTRHLSHAITKLLQQQRAAPPPVPEATPQQQQGWDSQPGPSDSREARPSSSGTRIRPVSPVPAHAMRFDSTTAGGYRDPPDVPRSAPGASGSTDRSPLQPQRRVATSEQQQQRAEKEVVKKPHSSNGSYTPPPGQARAVWSDDGGPETVEMKRKKEEARRERVYRWRRKVAAKRIQRWWRRVRYWKRAGKLWRSDRSVRTQRAEAVVYRRDLANRVGAARTTRQQLRRAAATAAPDDLRRLLEWDSAVVLQSFARQLIAYNELRLLQWAVFTLQRVARGHIARRFEVPRQRAVRRHERLRRHRTTFARRLEADRRTQTQMDEIVTWHLNVGPEVERRDKEVKIEEENFHKKWKEWDRKMTHQMLHSPPVDGDWVQKTDNTRGRVYFLNVKNNAVSHDHPNMKYVEDARAQQWAVAEETFTDRMNTLAEYGQMLVQREVENRHMQWGTALGVIRQVYDG